MLLNNEIKENLLKEIKIDFQGQEELIPQILHKFDLLLNKEEYYNYQERVYKLNKAFTSISRAKNLTVSNFTDSEGIYENTKGPLVKLDISLENLSNILDDLIKEKENYVEGQYMSVNTSSSEEDSKRKFSLAEVDNKTLSDKRNKLFRNLYNYELVLKTYFYEKTLNTEKEQEMLEDLQGNITHSDFSTNNVSLKPNHISDSIIGTPLTKSSKIMDGSANTLKFTPSIKKSFFEDKDIKKCIDKRRRSMVEELKVNLGSNMRMTKARHMSRKSMIIEASEKYSHSCSNNHKKIQPGSSNKTEESQEKIDEGEISAFNCQVQSKSQFSTQSNLIDNRRTSIFREKENFLSNIVENEEFNCNMSFEDSLNSDDSDVDNDQ